MDGKVWKKRYGVAVVCLAVAGGVLAVLLLRRLPGMMAGMMREMMSRMMEDGGCAEMCERMMERFVQARGERENVHT